MRKAPLRSSMLVMGLAVVAPMDIVVDSVFEVEVSVAAGWSLVGK